MHRKGTSMVPAEDATFFSSVDQTGEPTWVGCRRDQRAATRSASNSNIVATKDSMSSPYTMSA